MLPPGCGLRYTLGNKKRNTACATRWFARVSRLHPLVRPATIRPARDEETMDDNASFGYWIRRRRKALDLTQATLARQVG